MAEGNEKNEEQEPCSRRTFGSVAVGAGLASAFLGANVSAQEASHVAVKEDSAPTTPEGFEGNIAVCTVLTVEEKLESAADSVWDRHKKWLKATHGPWGMFTYTVAKNVE